MIGAMIGILVGVYLVGTREGNRILRGIWYLFLVLLCAGWIVGFSWFWSHVIMLIGR